MMSLETTLDDLKRANPGREDVEFAITSLDVTGLPVWSVTQWQHDGEMINGIGYGPSDLRARVGAWAELLEQTGSHGVTKLPQTRGSFNDLDGEKIDPRALRLPAGTAYDHDVPLTWVQVRRYEAGRELADLPPVWCPIEAVATHSYDLGDAVKTPLFQPISNGNGAGDTMDRAICHGLLELVQRDGNSAGYRAVDRHIRVELDDVRNEETKRLLAKLDEAGIEVIVKLADTNLGMANLYVVGHEREPGTTPHPIMLSGCGEAAHPDREAALQKALYEFCASRVRKFFTHGPIAQLQHLFPQGYLQKFRENPASVEESRSFDDCRRLAHMSSGEVMALMKQQVFRVEETVKFSALPTVEPAAVDQVPTLLAETVRRFEAENLPIYVAEYHQGEGTAACKVIVPAMEVETMTYQRIGRRNLDRLTSRGFDFVGYGEPPAGANRVLLPDGEAAWLDSAKLAAQIGDQYCLYREPEVHAVALADEQEGAA
jgi:ribosomal protein S12 methylthiotransferase accessory factor